MHFYWPEQRDSKRNLHQRKIFISIESAIKPQLNEKYILTHSFSEQNEQTILKSLNN
ncbi:hypothetical protein D3C80_1402650 [compost metagenome]|jgi:hypothetical protein